MPPDVQSRCPAGFGFTPSRTRIQVFKDVPSLEFWNTVNFFLSILRSLPSIQFSTFALCDHSYLVIFQFLFCVVVRSFFCAAIRTNFLLCLFPMKIWLWRRRPPLSESRSKKLEIYTLTTPPSCSRQGIPLNSQLTD